MADCQGTSRHAASEITEIGLDPVSIERVADFGIHCQTQILDFEAYSQFQAL
jgi:hypothetical protein